MNHKKLAISETPKEPEFNRNLLRKVDELELISKINELFKK